MGFSVAFELTESVPVEKEAAIVKALESLRHGRTWLSCEPPFLRNYDGVLSGFSKPNFMPHRDNVASAEAEGLPDGTLNDLLDILCQLSPPSSRLTGKFRMTTRMDLWGTFAAEMLTKTCESNAKRSTIWPQILGSRDSRSMTCHASRFILPSIRPTSPISDYSQVRIE